MKALSIVPLDIHRTPAIATQKSRDQAFIRALPSEVCSSFREAQTILRKNRFSYDIILSTYTPEEFLPVEDIVPSSDGYYGSASHHISNILTDNPFATLVLWTGAHPHDLARSLSAEATERLAVFDRGNRLLVGGVSGSSDAEMANLRATITDAITEFSLSLTDKDNVTLTGVCNRGPVALAPAGPQVILPVRPSLRRGFRSLEEEIAEFEALVNTKGVSERQVEMFLRSHPYFLLGNRYRSLRWQLHLKREAEGKGDLIPDILLEPISASDHWKVQDLKAPDASIARLAPANRQGFSSQVLTALHQLREYRDYFDNPLYRRQLEDLGITAYKPEISLVIGRDYRGLSPEQIIKAKGDFGQLEVMTYSELIERVRNGMMWMADAIDRGLGRNERL